MKQAARTDANQAEIVRIFRKAGATVQSLADVGKGVPDLLLGFMGYNILVEVKDGNKPPSARKLTPDQIKWHSNWRCKVHIVKDYQDCAELVCEYRMRAKNE